MRSERQAGMKCPYFETDSDQYITCEGVYSATIKQRFLNGSELKAFEQKYCMRYPNQCSIAKLIDRKYGDDTEG